MASREAKHFLFLSKSGSSNADAQLLLDKLNEAGCDAQVLQIDVGDSVALDEVIRAHAEKMLLIRDFIQGAMALTNSTFETMTSTVFEASVRSKAVASWNFHEVLPKDLNFFILLSSCGDIIGNRGQGNYHIGNTFQDALAHNRRSQCLGGTSLDLGHMLNIGVIVERTDNLFQAAFGNQAISQDEFHAFPEQLPSAKLRCLPTDYGALDKSHPEKRLQIVVEGIIEKLSNLLSISTTEIDSEMAPSDYGVDSLVDIEVRNWPSKEVGVEVGVLDIKGSQSIVDWGRVKDV